MRINIPVKMRAEFIYDLLLFHTYSKFSGFLTNVLGMAVIIIGGISLGAGRIELYQALLYVAAGIGFLAYTPFTLKRRAKQAMKMEKYKSDMSYVFDENGIEENIDDNATCYAWDKVEKAIATPKNIAFYVGKEDALIVPKECFQDDFMPVMKLIAENVTRDRIYIR